MIVGRQKADFRIRVFDCKTNKSKYVSFHVKDEEMNLDQLTKIVIDGVTNRKN